METLAEPAGWASFEQEELRFVDRRGGPVALRGRHSCTRNIGGQRMAWQARGRATKPWAALQPFLAACPAIVLPPWPVERFGDQPDLSPGARAAAAGGPQPRVRKCHAAELPDHRDFQHGGAFWESDEERRGACGARLGLVAPFASGARRQEPGVFSPGTGGGRAVASGRRGAPERAIGEAVDVIGRVRASSFWDRVRQAEERLVEVPLAALQDEVRKSRPSPGASSTSH